MREHVLACAAFALFTAVFIPSLSWAQMRPVPPGIRAADRNEDQTQAQIPPPAPAVQKLNLDDVLQQSDELLALAQQVHSDTRNATQGLLAKDLKDKLKRMEKLSKKLREELTP